MSIVKINAIEVPEGAGPELEARFAARMGAVEGSPGFLGFELLRPTAGETRYFVYTRWETEEAFRAWSDGPARAAHAGPPAADGSTAHGSAADGSTTDGEPAAARRPVATGASLLEFEVVATAGPTAG